MVIDKNYEITSNYDYRSSDFKNIEYEITFIVLSFNNDLYLNETLNSVENQNIISMQIIIGDDFSRDSSRNIIESFVKNTKYNTLSILNNKNLGLNNNYNNCLSLARGKYIAHIGSDDINIFGRCNKQLELIKKTGASMCVASMSLIDKKGRYLYTKDAKKSCTSTFDGLIKYGEFYSNSPTMLYHRDLIDTFGLLPINIVNEDEVLLFRALASNGICILDDEVVKYRIHSQSITGRNGGLSFKKFIQFYYNDLLNQINNRIEWLRIANIKSCDYYIINAILLQISQREDLRKTIKFFFINPSFGKIFSIFSNKNAILCIKRYAINLRIILGRFYLIYIK